MVLLQHGADNLKSIGVESDNLKTPWFSIGVEGVYLFFMLSGYLLAKLYLLGDNRLSFEVSKFYKKRFWRIFPLYLIAVFSAYFLLSGSDFIHHDYHEIKNRLVYFPLFLLGLPNFVIGLSGLKFGSLTALWSIGTELQFYLIFPLLVFYFRKVGYKKLFVFGSMIIAYLLFYYFRKLSGSHYLKITLSTLRFDLLFIGVCSANLFANLKLNNIFILNSRVVDLGVLISILGLLFGLTLNIIWVKEVVLIVSFLGLIYFLGTKESKTFFDWSFIHYLGTISYGIYIYHPLVSYPLRFLADKMIDVSTFSQLVISLIYFLLLFGVTVFVAHLSYHFIEKKLFYRTQ